MLWVSGFLAGISFGIVIVFAAAYIASATEKKNDRKGGKQ
jgi:hypothetical protein